MKVKDGLAAQYWIDNTQRIYDEDLHVSSPIMDAYKAGFEAAREMSKSIIRNACELGFIHGDTTTLSDVVNNLGEEDET